MPHHDGITLLPTRIAGGKKKKKKRLVLSSLSRTGLSQKAISGDPSGTSATVLMHFQETGTRRPMWLLCFTEQVSGKQNTSVKGERIFLKTQSHTNDLDSWLNTLPEMKIYCMLAIVTTGGWNSGHLPNHLEHLYDWQATASYGTLPL